MNEPTIKRFECACYSYTHSLRVSKYEDGYVSLEVLLNKYPENIEPKTKWHKFLNWLVGIKNAVFGLDNWYSAEILIDNNTSKQLSEYLKDICS